MMDRSKRDELPKMQVGFIDNICLELYEVGKHFYGKIQSCVLRLLMLYI